MNGHVAPGFEPVADAFARNFIDHGEIGAAFAAARDGVPVVDLWGGVADVATGRLWAQDTLQLIFSGTKGLVATCVTMLLDRGAIDLADPVSRHWPEFGAAGKEAITIGEVVSHRGRVPGLHVAVGEDDLLLPRRMAALIAERAPEDDPRAALTYHALTYGWLCAELIERVDGRSAGRFLAEEVARPLDLELWLGLPPELEPRVSALAYAPGWGDGPQQPRDGDALWRSLFENPPLFPPDRIPWNDPAWHAAEIPGANAIGTARSIARLYGALARGGELDGVRLVSTDALAVASAPLAQGPDPFTGEPLAYGVGFELQTAKATFGPVARAFGHTGAGGSVHGAWPERRVGFSYAMNTMRDEATADPRATALLEALHGCLD